MKVFIMRHGEAEVVSSSDETRRLTGYGRKQSISQGQWLKTHLNSTALSVQKVIVSPYVRAQETFEFVNLALVGSIVSELYGKRNPISFYPSTIVQIDWNGEKGIIEACNSYKEHD